MDCGSVSLLLPLTCIAKLFVEPILQMQLGGSRFDGLLETDGGGGNYKIQLLFLLTYHKSLKQDVFIFRGEAYS